MRPLHKVPWLPGIAVGRRVNGAVGYAGEDVADRVVSREFYTLRVREDREGDADARYLALLMRTPHARELVAGTVTGTSNRTRVEDETSLLALPLPPSVI